MSTGWPQNQQDLRWPQARDEDSSDRGQSARNRRLGDATFGTEHPSAPLPVAGPGQRGRFGRRRESKAGDDELGFGDEDYDWIRYLGEAGPASEPTRSQLASGRSDVLPGRQPIASPGPADPATARQQIRDFARRDALPRRPAESLLHDPRQPDLRGAEARRADTAGPQRRATVRPAEPQPEPQQAEAWRTAPGLTDAWKTAPAPGAPPRTGPRPHHPGHLQRRDLADQPQSQPSPRAERLPARNPAASVGSAYDRAARLPSGSGALQTGRQAGPDPAGQPLQRRRGPGAPAAGARLEAAPVPAGLEQRATASPAPRGTAVEQAPGRRVRHAGKRRPSRFRRTKPAVPVSADRQVQASGASVALAPPSGASVALAPARDRGPAVSQPRPVPSARKKTLRRGLTRRTVGVLAAVAVLAAGGAFALHVFFARDGSAHVVATPQRLLGYVQAPTLAKGMGAAALRSEILAKGEGEASHVVDAVYDDANSKAGPLIILFIGGNLADSASSFIASFTGSLPGAFVTSAGAMGGQAACVPSFSGHPAECAWADNDTFGLIASPNLNASSLAKQLREIRPLVEHKVK